MAIISDKTKVQDLIRALSILYDKFYTNRQYKDLQYKDKEEEYLKEQNILADDIKKYENQIFDMLKKYFSELFPTLNLIAYDSRFVFLSKSKIVIGALLVEGMNDEDEIAIKKFLQETLFVEGRIDKFEDLPEEIRKKFKK